MCQSNLFQFGEDEEKEGREEGMTVRGDGGGLPRFNWPALACYSEVSMMPSLNICSRLHADTTSRSTVGNLTATGLTANIWVSPVSTHLFKCRIQPLPASTWADGRKTLCSKATSLPELMTQNNTRLVSLGTLFLLSTRPDRAICVIIKNKPNYSFSCLNCWFGGLTITF